MIIASVQFLGFLLINRKRAFSLHSSITSLGIIVTRRAVPAGAMIKSSRYPITGMKSGIKSIGLKTYPIMKTPKTFAYQGVFGCLEASQRAHTSLFNYFDLVLQFLISPFKILSNSLWCLPPLHPFFIHPLTCHLHHLPSK